MCFAKAQQNFGVGIVVLTFSIVNVVFVQVIKRCKCTDKMYRQNLSPRMLISMHNIIAYFPLFSHMKEVDTLAHSFNSGQVWESWAYTFKTRFGTLGPYFVDRLEPWAPGLIHGYVFCHFPCIRRTTMLLLIFRHHANVDCPER